MTQLYYGYIYKITCLINNKCYVGQKRKSTFDSKYWGSSKNEAYWNDIKSFGKENFKREILYWAVNQEELNIKETEYIIKEKALFSEGGYNLWLNRPQVELSNEIIEKHHTNLLKVVHSQEYREKMKKIAESRKGKPISEKIRRKLSESLKNSEKRKKTMASEEYRKKMSEAVKNSEKHRRWYMDPELRALRFNKEVNKKISKIVSENNKGKHWYTNEEINVFVKECPEGFKPGRSKKVRNNISKGRLNAKIKK